MARMRLTVSRTDLLADAIAFFKSGQYHHDRPLNVRFEGEPAVDGGGPRREFFSLLLQKMLSPTSQYRLLEGRPGRYLPMHNLDALVGGLFKVYGQIIAASALQGGPGFPCLAPPIYSYLVTSSDPFVAETLKTISELEDDNPEFHNVASSLSEPLAIAGYTHRLTSTNKADAMLKIMLHDVILSRKAEIDQLALGLGPVLELAKANPESMRSLFTATDLKPLTSESFLELCTFQPTVPADLKTLFIQYGAVSCPAYHAGQLSFGDY
ncbi:uncharacterized protein LOC134176580 [Corticium candelabrum]|uniref:uncharacterized protein LOC134176580 n=1 Tax=Corticium candelabrum TaxID=121492 RepID=UPI002E27190B|nr:uncharacterized protein LOC134176580 [Corticium candelabrum]